MWANKWLGILQSSLCLCDCSGALRTPTSQVCRAGGIKAYEPVCQQHFDKIHQEDDKFMSLKSGPPA